MSKFIGDEISSKDLKKIIADSYETEVAKGVVFRDEFVTPVKKVGGKSDVIKLEII